MIKDTDSWTVQDLVERHLTISFPEYQRESTVWNLRAKQRLVDSMLRQFDIACLYFYREHETSVECIDGRQRIAAIMSFLSKNDADTVDNGFRLRISNEIYDDENFKYSPPQWAYIRTAAGSFGPWRCTGDRVNERIRTI